MTWKQFAPTALLAISSALALSACANSEGSSASSSRPETPPASCPSKALKEGAEAATNRNIRSNKSLVPNQPNELLLCRYYGLGIDQTPQTQARAGKLAAERLLRRPGVVRTIGREFDDLRQVSRSATFSCPFDEGAMLYAIFGYASEPVVPVEVSLSGCRFARNGRARPAFMSARLRDRLESLIPLRS
jgi:hypothetical protein